MRSFSEEANAQFATLVGQVVVKTSGKPFKSGAKRATVTGTRLHPVTGHLCYTFAEDDSYVECFRCQAHAARESALA